MNKKELGNAINYLVPMNLIFLEISRLAMTSLNVYTISQRLIRAYLAVSSNATK